MSDPHPTPAPVDLPPYARLLGLIVEGTDDAGPAGRAPVLVMPFADAVLGRPGFLQGGAIAGLLEMAAIAALRAALSADGGGRIKPVDVSVDYMRGGRDHPTRATGIVTRLGTRVANVRAHAWQGDPDQPIASARMNYLVVRD